MNQPAGVDVDYTLSGEERLRYAREVTGASELGWNEIAVAVLIVLQFVNFVARYPQNVFYRIALCGALIALVLRVIAFYKQSRGLLPATQQVHLRITDAGVIAEIGGRTRAYGWSEIREVRDLGEFYHIRAGRGLIGRAIYLPKRVLSDGGLDVWDLFERRMIGTRLLRLPTMPMTRIVNTAN